MDRTRKTINKNTELILPFMCKYEPIAKSLIINEGISPVFQKETKYIKENEEL